MYILGYMVSDQLHDAPTQCCFTCYYGQRVLNKTVAISALTQHTNQTDVTLSFQPLVGASQFHTYILFDANSSLFHSYAFGGSMES